jgi:hypothetical protein
MTGQAWVYVILAIAGAALWVHSVGGINVAWYSLRYGVSASKVQVDAQPSDCDFMTAPLGSKGCHYDAFVDVFNKEGFLVGGDHVPYYIRKIDTGKIYLSYDNDKISELPDFPNSKADRVEVSWIKKPD